MRWFSVGVEPVGVVAIGANATGVIAIGQLATGVVAVGQLARGGIVLGQLAVGIVAVGQLAIGVAKAAGMLGVAWRAIGGLAWKAPPVVVAVLAVVWWLAAGMWVWDALSREGGIVRDPPPAACADDPFRSC
jgi:hypothetical protein